MTSSFYLAQRKEEPEWKLDALARRAGVASYPVDFSSVYMRTSGGECHPDYQTVDIGQNGAKVCIRARESPFFGAPAPRAWMYNRGVDRDSDLRRDAGSKVILSEYGMRPDQITQRRKESEQFKCAFPNVLRDHSTSKNGIYDAADVNPSTNRIEYPSASSQNREAEMRTLSPRSHDAQNSKYDPQQSLDLQYKTRYIRQAQAYDGLGLGADVGATAYNLNITRSQQFVARPLNKVQ